MTGELGGSAGGVSYAGEGREWMVCAEVALWRPPGSCRLIAVLR